MLQRTCMKPLRAILIASLLACVHGAGAQGIFFSADFNDGAWPASFDLGPEVERLTPDGEGTGEFVPAWRIGNATDANAGGFFEVPDAPVGNRFAMANDDAEPCNCDLADVSLTIAAPSFVGRSGVALECRIFHDRALLGGEAELELSLAGGSWIPLATIPVLEQEWQPLFVNLSAFDGLDDIRIRFRWSDDGHWASGFAVDDIVLRERTTIDLAVEQIFTYDPAADPFTVGDQALRYALLPLEQASAMWVSAELMNRGTQALTGFSATATVALDGVVQASYDTTLSGTLLPGERMLIRILTDWTPSAVGQVTATFTANPMLPDADIDNNNGTATLQITGPGWEGRYGAMARDEGSVQGAVGGAFNFIALARVEMANTGSTAQGLSAYVTYSSAVGQQVRAILFNADFAFVDSSARHTLTQEDIDRAGVGESLYLGYTEQVELSAGDYFAGIQRLDGSDAVYIGISGNAPIGASVLMQGPTFVVDYLRTAPMVRLHLDGFGVGIAEQGSMRQGSLRVHPVPLTGDGTVRFSLAQASSPTLRVLDMSGRVIVTTPLGSLPQGEHATALASAALSDGLYIVEVQAGSERLWAKVIVAH